MSSSNQTGAGDAGDADRMIISSSDEVGEGVLHELGERLNTVNEWYVPNKFISNLRSLPRRQ
jgi:hypothetical protein